MNKFLLILLAITSNFLFSQSYCTLHLAGDAHFKDSTNNLVYSFNSDSTVVHNDTTTVYNYRMIRQDLNDSYIFHLNGASWSGEKTDILLNGLNLYYNKYGDTIFIHTLDTLGSSWRFFNYQNGDYIEATISDIQYETILSFLTDSVKTITLQVKNSLGQNISSDLNSHYLLLSKNFGLIRTFLFYEFPFNVQFELIGLESPITGWQNYSGHEVFDFNVGDEFHTYYHDFVWTNSYTIKKTIKKVIDKYISGNNDTIIYTFDRCEREEISITGQNVQYNLISDTITEKVIFSEISFLENYSFQPYTTDDWNYYYKNKFIDYIADDPAIYYSSGMQDTLSELIYDGNCYYEFMIGLGKYFDCDGLSGATNYDLVYYKKGINEWGIPYNCDSLLNEISSYDFGGEIKIYPNPVSDVLFIESEGQIERIEIFDNMSQLIRTENLNFNNIDVSQLMPGLYLIKINTDKQVFVRKFIKS